MQRNKQFTSWSFSRYTDWLLCPLKAKLAHLVKLPQEKGQALIHGGNVHKEAEAVLKGGMAKVPPSLVMFHDLFIRLAKKRKKDVDTVVVEDDWAFTKAWEVTRWDDWDNCWLRIKVDCLEFMNQAEAVVRDWKTGKFSDWNLGQYQEQLELYAVGTFALYPTVTVVRPQLVFLEPGVIWDKDAATKHPLVYTRREHFEPLKAKWAARVRPMLGDTLFKAKPNRLCGWCPYRKSAGGPCKEG